MVGNKETFESILHEDVINLDRQKVKDNYYLNYIYILFRKGKMVYIGRSKYYPHQRIESHIGSKKVFDEFTIIKIGEEYDKEQLEGVEASLIIKYQPEYNTVLPPNNCWAIAKYLRAKLGIKYSRFIKVTQNVDMSKYECYFRGRIYLNIKKFKAELL